MAHQKLHKKALFALITACLALGLVGMPAQADPPAGSAAFLAGSGSDTTQDVMQGVANASGGVIESWNATPRSPEIIEPKLFGFDVYRPHGSIQGLNALRRSRGTAAGMPPSAVPLGSDVFDFARSSAWSSRYPGTDADVNGQLIYIPFALDAVAIATGPTSAIDADFTLTQLYTMYQTGGSVTVGGVTYTPDVNITLLIPQSGSGTGQFWADTMGIDMFLPPAWVHDEIDGVPVQPNDGSVLAANPEAIGPFSVGSWIGQGNGLPGVVDRRDGAVLHALDGEPAYDVVSGEEVLNRDFPITREVYNIVAFNEANGGDIDIVDSFVGPNSTTCSSLTNGRNTIEVYGFGLLDSTTAHTCGELDPSLRAYRNG